MSQAVGFYAGCVCCGSTFWLEMCRQMSPFKELTSGELTALWGHWLNVGYSWDMLIDHVVCSGDTSHCKHMARQTLSCILLLLLPRFRSEHARQVLHCRHRRYPQLHHLPCQHLWPWPEEAACLCALPPWLHNHEPNRPYNSQAVR